MLRSGCYRGLYIIKSQQDSHGQDGNILREKATEFCAGVKTHLAGFERKRSRSFLLMDHGGL